MGKFSDKFLNAFMKGDDEYDDDFDEYDDILDEDEYFPEDNFEEVPAPAPRKKERAVPEEKPARSFARPAKTSYHSGKVGQQEVCVFKPSSIEDSREITETLLLGKAVIINFEGLHVEISQRIIDFISGSCYALDGNLQKISNYIFIATPNSVDISGDFQDLFGGGDNSFDIAGFKSPLL